MAVTSETKMNPIATPASMNTRLSILPLILTMTLFSVWGMAGGISDVLTKRFQDALNLTKLQSTGTSITYYAAYAICPLTISGWLLRNFGYRVSFIVGLCTYATGCLLFWPSGHMRSYGGFCGSTFIIASGMATLETALIPFITTHGSARWAEMRVNLVAAFQSVMHIIALILASYVIMKEPENGKVSLKSIQWIYLGIGCFMCALAVVFYFTPIIEITDEELDRQWRDDQNGEEVQPLSRQFTLFCGIFAAFAWTGTQSGISTFFINYVLDIKPGATPRYAAQTMAIAHGIFTAGRFTTCVLMQWFKPRFILLFAMGFVIIFLSATLGSTGNTGLAMLLAENFFKSCVFPTIFVISLKGLGRHTKIGASLMVSTVSSGMISAPAMGAIADASNTRISFSIPLAGTLLAASFPIYINLVRANESENSVRRSRVLSDSSTDEGKENGSKIEKAELSNQGSPRATTST